jgi:hypothetical protein
MQHIPFQRAVLPELVHESVRIVAIGAHRLISRVFLDWLTRGADDAISGVVLMSHGLVGYSHLVIERQRHSQIGTSRSIPVEHGGQMLVATCRDNESFIAPTLERLLWESIVGRRMLQDSGGAATIPIEIDFFA